MNCCKHCDRTDDWHITEGTDVHEDPCPYGCNGEDDAA